MDELDETHVCEEYDQLNTCVECGAPRNRMIPARFSGGAGVAVHPLSDDDYHREMEKLTR